MNFEARLEAEFNRARRTGRSAGLLVLETNATPDVRSYDVVSRNGGVLEILLGDSDRADLESVAKRLLEKFGGRAGGAIFPDDAVSTAELRAAANRALEAAKPGALAMAAPAAPNRDRAAEMDRLVTSKSGRTVVTMVSKVLREGGDVEQMLRRTLDLMAKAVEADRGLIFLLQDAGRLRAVLDMPDMPVELDADDYSTNVLRRAISTGHPVRIEDVDKDTWASGLASVQQMGMRSILVVPIVSGGKVLGAVYLDSRKKDKKFSASEEELLVTFSSLIAKPIDQGAEIKRRSEEVSRLQDVVRSGLSELGKRYQFGAIIGRSEPMRRVFEMIERVAPSPYPVVLLGETGTGKELVSKAIHFNSPRKEKPFLPVNCGAVAETLLESQLFGHVKGAFTGADQSRPGLFEAASGGTLFLDEVEEMSDGMQKKMLRVLEESQVWPVGGREPIQIDVRIVAATNEELDVLIEEERFRRDLYYRLNTFTLKLPPLRERAEDLPLLIDHFLEDIAKETQGPRLRVSREAMALMMRYPWPGNVRELRNEMRKLSVMARGEVQPADLPEHIRETTGSIGRDNTLRDRLGEVDKKLIVEALDRNDWNISRASEDLGINRNTLKTRMRKHGIRKTER